MCGCIHSICSSKSHAQIERKRGEGEGGGREVTLAWLPFLLLELLFPTGVPTGMMMDSTVLCFSTTCVSFTVCERGLSGDWSLFN